MYDFCTVSEYWTHKPQRLQIKWTALNSKTVSFGFYLKTSCDTDVYLYKENDLFIDFSGMFTLHVFCRV